MACWAGYEGLEALVTVNSLVEDGMCWVENVKDRVGVHLLTGCVNADMEVRSSSSQKLVKIGSLEDANLDDIVLVLK